MNLLKKIIKYNTIKVKHKFTVLLINYILYNTTILYNIQTEEQNLWSGVWQIFERFHVKSHTYPTYSCQGDNLLNIVHNVKCSELCLQYLSNFKI